MAEYTKTANGDTNVNTSLEREEKAPWEKLAITMDKRADVAVAVATVLLGALMLILARDIRPGTVDDPVTSQGIPNILGAFLVIGGTALIVIRLLSWSQLPGHLVVEEGQEDEKGYPASWARAIGVILVSALWGWLLKPLGFLLITPLYLLVTLWIMGVRSWLKLISFTIIYTVTSWVIFGPLLGSRLPLGPLTPLAESLGIFL